MHTVAARLGFEKAMVGTRWATPRLDCMYRLRKHYSHLAEGWFLERKAAWALSGCMATNSADYRIAGKFGEEFNLANWRGILKNAKLKVTNFEIYTLNGMCLYF